MKKQIAIVSTIIASFAGAFAADATVAAQPKSGAESLADINASYNVFDHFSATATFGYESEYVFRGMRTARASFIPSLDLGYDIGSGFALYSGVCDIASTGDDPSEYNEVDITFGATYTVKNFTFDVGYLAYIYAKTPSTFDTNNEHEVKLGVSYDTTDILGDFNVSPFLNYYFNCTNDYNVFEMGFNYSAPITKWINGDEWGSLYCEALYGQVIAEGDKQDYGYFGLRCDAVIRLTKAASFTFGIRYQYATDGGSELINGVSHADCYAQDSVWWGSTVSIGF